MREWEIVNLGLPQLSDVINMGAGNFTLGWFFRLNDFSMWRVKLENEVCQGYSLVFWALVIYLAWCYLRRRSAFAFPTTDQSEFGTFRHLVIRSLGVATVFSFVLIISFGSCSLWWFFWKCMPGASSLRFMGRWWLFLLLPFSILSFAASCILRLIDSASSRSAALACFSISRRASRCVILASF